jgi:acetyltransferase-like isoleucine patch superfamily enzyme
MKKTHDFTKGNNCTIGEGVTFGRNVCIGHNCIIEDNVFLNDDVFIDSNSIIRRNVILGSGTMVGSNCILGEYLMDFYQTRQNNTHPLRIGNNALIRSGTIIYGDTNIGNNFQTGHRVTIREKASIGDNVNIGTLSDIQGNCQIGNYVHLHSNVHIGQLSKIDSCVWIFPYVILTNDPTPPSENLVGVHIYSYAIVATGSIIMPGIQIGMDSLVGAGAIVTKDVDPYAVAVGNPAKKISDVRNIKNKITGEAVYPWRHHFDRSMPWEGNNFDSWYASLDIDKRNEYRVN